MQLQIDRDGLMVDENRKRIGPSVNQHTIVGTGRMDGWTGVTVRLWHTIMTSDREHVSAIDANHNVQFRIEASDAKALAHALLDEIERIEALR